ncbi:MAG: glycosyltransferase family 2 protein [Bdellovibrionota bacterium]
MNQQKMTSTLVVPTLNEITAIQVIMPQIKKEWVDQILIVDGGSNDGTLEYFKTHGYEVHSQSKRGFGEAMKQGMLMAKGDIIIEFTPDGNSLPESIPQLIQKVHEGYDLVVASRYKDSAKSLDDDWLTGFGNWMFTKIVNFLFKAQITDILVGYRAYRKDIALKLNLDAPGLSWPCQTTLRFQWQGYKVTEIGADEPPRIGGERKMRPFKTGIEIVKTILREFYLFISSRVRKTKFN